MTKYFVKSLILSGNSFILYHFLVRLFEPHGKWFIVFRISGLLR
jgi:hypothetical protein